ncbi:hypothetical protein J6590_001105 [Homalodisca vitripennis]|nr:hypothetical protein J6590_001105 [Homalodisca vitripennis]
MPAGLRVDFGVYTRSPPILSDVPPPLIKVESPLSNRRGLVLVEGAAPLINKARTRFRNMTESRDLLRAVQIFECQLHLNVLLSRRYQQGKMGHCLSLRVTTRMRRRGGKVNGGQEGEEQVKYELDCVDKRCFQSTTSLILICKCPHRSSTVDLSGQTSFLWTSDPPGKSESVTNVTERRQMAPRFRPQVGVGARVLIIDGKWGLGEITARGVTV